jgi:hypothetical protein
LLRQSFAPTDHSVDNKNIEIRFPLDKTTALIVMQDLKRVEQFSALLEAGNQEEAMQLRESVPVTSFMKAAPQLIEAVNIDTARYARRSFSLTPRTTRNDGVCIWRSTAASRMKWVGISSEKGAICLPEMSQWGSVMLVPDAPRMSRKGAVDIFCR